MKLQDFVDALVKAPACYEGEHPKNIECGGCLTQRVGIVVSMERDRCAKIADEMFQQYVDEGWEGGAAIKEIAERIREGK